MQGSSKGHLLLKVAFHCRSSSTTGCLPSKVVFHQRLSSIEGHPPLKAIFHQKSSSISGHLPPKVVFHKSLSSLKVVHHWRSSSIEGCLLSQVILHQMLSSIEGCLTLRGILHASCRDLECARCLQKYLRLNWNIETHITQSHTLGIYIRRFKTLTKDIRHMKYQRVSMVSRYRKSIFDVRDVEDYCQLCANAPPPKGSLSHQCGTTLCHTPPIQPNPIDSNFAFQNGINFINPILPGGGR